MTQSPALDYGIANSERFLRELEALTCIPSISTDPAYDQDIKRAAEWLKDRMEVAGLQSVEVAPTAGHPVVYGEWKGAGAGAPTVLLYAHYDVQPAELTDGWKTEPFKPTRKDGKIYARGVGDDKLHSVMIIQLAESFIKSGEMSPVNLKLIIEGEEEKTSPNLAPWIRENRDRLSADYVLICDGGIKSPDRPTIVYGLRGALGMEFTVHGPSTDLHSGLFGGCVHNPAQVIAEMVAKLHHPDGRVAVPGFYDEVKEMSAEERHQLNMNPVTAEELHSGTGIPDTWGEPGYTLLERSVARPTLEINGIYGGFTGEGMKTVIPATASAKITCRLVNDQVPSTIAQLIESYLNEIKPSTVTLKVKHQGEGDPVTVPIDSPLVQALDRSMEMTWGFKPEYRRMGGSVPVAPVFQNELGVPTLLLGFNVDNGGFHGPNEFIHMELFHKGLKTMVHLLRDLGDCS
ncbi:MAG: dipeptidase [Puniceicoccaceae bacterium]